MHPLLKRQLDRLGLAPDIAPDVATWARLIARIDASYEQADQSRELVERSLALSSQEMRDLHDRLQQSNDALEDKVRARTLELEQLNASHVQEIGERRRTEAALAESERWIRLVNDNLPVMIAYVGADQIYRYHNRAFGEWLGVDAARITGHCVRDVMGPEAYLVLEPHIRAVLGGRVERFERAHRSRNGKTQYLDCGFLPDVRADGTVAGYYAMLFDITARKQAERRAVENEARFRSLTELSSDWYWEQDAELRFVTTAGRSDERGGITAAAHDGRRRWELPGTEPASGTWDRHKEDLAARRPFRDLMLKRVTPEGVRYVSVAGTPIFDENGAFAGYRGIARDVTELEAQRIQLSEAKEAAEAASRAKSEFLARMSHEIRTPMNGVLGMTELLRATPLTAEQRRFVDAVHGSGEALLRIINDILDFSKIEAGKLELEHVDFPLVGCVEDTVELLRGRASAKGLVIRVQPADTVPRCVSGDPARLRQILTNLVGNAIKFTERGVIQVDMDLACREGDDAVVRFAVTDHGIGIAPDVQAHVFDAFAQADGSTSRRYGGTGLGLAICRQLVELLGGEIGLRSAPGEGSTFWFTARFPVRAPVPAKVRTAVRSPTRTVGAEPSPTCSDAVRARARVLLAEDNPVNREVALAMLGSLGIAVDTKEDGEKAVDAIAATDYDIVLMDCQMPELDGFAATGRIRARERAEGRRRMPIVALTANAMNGDREACLAAGMDDYLSKPFTLAQLKAMLEKWLPRAADQRRPAA